MAFTIDETKTVQENFNVFLEGQKESSYTLGDYTGTAQGDMELYTELKVKVEQEKVKQTNFYSARDAAFQAFEVQKDQERQALAQLWQDAEDNDYTAI